MKDQLVQIALDAGKAVLQVYETMAADAARIKGDGSPVTAADERAERIILAGLARAAPGVPVVAEESVAAGRVPQTGAQPFFLVDPLDGTKEFLSRNGEFTVNIALIDSGLPVLGVVYAPALKEFFVGGRDQPAVRAEVFGHECSQWRRIVVRKAPELGLRIIASRTHLSDETREFVERFADAELVSAGSSLKFCRVASGDADVYPRHGRTMEWDIAAGHAVLAAAGGKVTDMAGCEMRYGKRNQASDTDFANPWFMAFGDIDQSRAI